MADWWDAARRWLYGHDVTIDLVTVWVLAVGFGALATVKLASWAVLRHQHDRTPVGRALKRQKVSEAVIHAVMAALYGLTLWAFYDGIVFGFWPRFGLRLLVIAGIAGAVAYGIRFVRARQAEDWGRPEGIDHRRFEQ